jgi:hypothetical protein
LKVGILLTMNDAVKYRTYRSYRSYYVDPCYILRLLAPPD